MGKILHLLFVISLVVDKWFINGAVVFVSQPLASSVLSRPRRHNSGHLEEMMRDNLERECIEERCSWEEAREVFENNEKTMEFWTGYIDGNQCESSPCQNGGRCEDGLSSYICWCQDGFGGKNCEIEIARQCNVKNGGCMQFCLEDKVLGATCACAPGYQLKADKMTCDPLKKYSCGQLAKTIQDKLSGRSLFNAEVLDQMEMAPSIINANESVPAGNVSSSNTTFIAVNSTIRDTDAPPIMNSTVKPNTIDGIASWNFFPTLPTITEKKDFDQRIVGGDEVTPGEIPWQVALINKATNLVFCGGSLLSDIWVITAAHCIVQSQGPFFIRLGEHHLRQHEKSESDHEVDRIVLHHQYKPKQSLYDHDIALLSLRTPAIFSDYIIPICLGPKAFTESVLQISSTSLVSGWGRMRYGGRDSAYLQKVAVPFVDRTECKRSSSDGISRFMFCAGYSHIEKDACQGDSGGPHASEFKGTWFLTGIISWGEECAKEGKYGIYTRVSRYYHWISNVTGLTLASAKGK